MIIKLQKGDQQEVARAIDYDGGNFSKILDGKGSLEGPAYLALYRYLSKKIWC